MYNLIRVEFFKLRKNRSFWTFLLALSVLSLAYPLLYYFDHRSNGEPQITGAEFLTTFISSNAYIIKFGVAILAGFFISNEYSTGVMKTIASLGNNRGRLFAAKLIVFVVGAMAISLVFPVVSTVEVTLLSGFGHLLEGSTTLFKPRALGLTLLYTAGYAAIGALFTVILTDSGKTIGFSMIFFQIINGRCRRVLLILTIILFAAGAFLFFRLLMLRRELGRITEQLHTYNERATGKKIDVALFYQKLEALAGQTNRQSDLIVEAEVQRRRVEQEFRQAVANISHDIRTPLTSISGYIQLLEDESITPDAKLEYVAIVKNRTKRLQALLNDFFELSLIESLDYPLHTEKLGMTVLLSEILFGFYDSFNDRNITPDIRLPEENVSVYADESDHDLPLETRRCWH